jgi:hypothetical protein
MKPATNRLSYGAAFAIFSVQYSKINGNFLKFAKRRRGAIFPEKSTPLSSTVTFLHNTHVIKLNMRNTITLFIVVMG